MRGLYAIVDLTSVRALSLDVAKFAHALLVARPAALQLRAKNVSPREVLSLLRTLAPACRERGVPLVANDRAELAVLGACDMVHIGQDDASPDQVRAISQTMPFGISTHTEAQLAHALDAGPRYVAYGPIFATRTKEKADPAVGLSGLAAAARIVQLHPKKMPLVAIGGITLERVASIAGLADMAAVIADLLPPSDLHGTDAYAWVTARALAFQAAFAIEASIEASP